MGLFFRGTCVATGSLVAFLYGDITTSTLTDGHRFWSRCIVLSRANRPLIFVTETSVYINDGGNSRRNITIF
ncbi:MAG: hypothetical protein NVSMB46_09360 [Candidatus Saccharimonadales bacterium]